MNQFSGTVANSGDNVRVEFIKKTYLHLAYAILAFIGLEYVLLNSPVAPILTRTMTSGMSWLIVLGVFMGVAYIADKWARSATSKSMQYMGLGLYVVAEAIIFVPLLYIAKLYAPNIIPLAGIFTGLLFVGLTFTAFTSKKDFSFLGGMLKIGGFIALGVIVVSIIFGFSLGILFSAFMILFASGTILYSTSNIIRHYHSEQYIAAALSLFASVALLFWYIIQLLMSLSGD